MAKDDIFHALKAILATQRDYGRRDDRKFSRLKYLVADWGVDKFRSVVEQYFGKRLEPLRCAACFCVCFSMCPFQALPACLSKNYSTALIAGLGPEDEEPTKCIARCGVCLF